MDDEEFKRKLSQVANWVIPEVNHDNAGAKALSRKKKQRLAELGQELDDKVNTTYPVKLLEVKTQAVDCVDCGQHCQFGRKMSTKRHQTFGVVHWRRHCMTCGFFENPNSGKFDLNIGASGYAWSEFIRQAKIK